MANLVELWDRLQIVANRADGDDPWRAQRIRSRVAGAIVVVIVLGVVITLIVLMTSFQSTAGSDALSATDNPITRCAPGTRGSVDTRFDGLRYQAAWRKARTLGVQLQVVAYNGKCDLTSPALSSEQPIVKAAMTDRKITFAVS